MSTEENAFEPGPEAEEGYDPDEVYAAEGEDTYPAGPESQQKEDRTPLIAGGIVVAALVAVTCCLVVVAAFLIRQSSGGGGDTIPTLPPIQLPTNTPVAPAPDVPTPTPGDEPQPTLTTAAGPNALIDAPAQADTGERVSFDGSQSQPGTSSIARYDWDFGDGNIGSGRVVSHQYAAPGTYTATVTATNSVSQETAVTTVQVNIVTDRVYIPLLTKS